VSQRMIKSVGAVVALTLAMQPLTGSAQQAPSGQWFVPGQPHSAPAARTAPRTPAPPPSPSPVANPGGLPLADTAGADQAGASPQLQVQLPPAPEIPPIPKGPATPAAIVGILSVPDVLRVSTAYQAAYKELNARGQKLNEDAQKEQVTLRDLGQALANDRAKMSPEQIRNRERDIQDRATEAQRRFGERNRIIQEASQYVMMQINRTMEQVAQQVALSRGINLVLNRAQILGTTADFDLTPAVAEVLNKVQASVVVPPDGISPMAMPTPGAAPAATAANNGAKPAATTKPPTKN
jgi:Skp family chaperone for outer membrane proteins